MGLLLRVALAAKMDVAFNSIDMRMFRQEAVVLVFDPDRGPARVVVEVMRLLLSNRKG